MENFRKMKITKMLS